MERPVITDEEIEAFAVDGVVCLRGAFGPEWIEPLRRGIEKNIAEPSDRARFWDRDAEGRTCFYDNQSWLHIHEYRDFAVGSPASEIAGHLLGATAVNFFYDAVFVRSPGNRFRTPFHQDEPYWSVEGFDTCSIWMPLVPVARESALELVRGSHLWPQRFRQEDFGTRTGDARDAITYAEDDGVPTLPDIEADRDAYEILAWDLDPGDAVVFNGRMVHGGSGNLAPDRDLQVFNTQWLGDDVKVAFRPEGMDPDHSGVMRAAGLRHGDRIGGDLYPELWWRSEPAAV